LSSAVPFLIWAAPLLLLLFDLGRLQQLLTTRKFVNQSLHPANVSNSTGQTRVDLLPLPSSTASAGHGADAA
jgi:hypothetical protein